MKKLVLFLALVVPATGCFPKVNWGKWKEKAKSGVQVVGGVTGATSLLETKGEEAKESAAAKAESFRLSGLFRAKPELEDLYKNWKEKEEGRKKIALQQRRIRRDFSRKGLRSPTALSRRISLWNRKVAAWGEQWEIAALPKNTKGSMDYLDSIDVLNNILELVADILDRAKEDVRDAPAFLTKMLKAKEEREAAEAAAAEEEDAEEEGAEYEASEDTEEPAEEVEEDMEEDEE